MTLEDGSPARGHGTGNTSVLVLEDDAYIAMEIEDVLKGAHYAVIGPVATVREAAALVAANGIDAAVVDINLRDGYAFRIAESLATRGVPIIFVTGFSASMIPEELRRYPMLRKPFTSAALLAALAAARSR